MFVHPRISLRKFADSACGEAVCSSHRDDSLLGQQKKPTCFGGRKKAEERVPRRPTADGEGGRPRERAKHDGQTVCQIPQKSAGGGEENRQAVGAPAPESAGTILFDPIVGLIQKICSPSSSLKYNKLRAPLTRRLCRGAELVKLGWALKKNEFSFRTTLRSRPPSRSRT